MTSIADVTAQLLLDDKSARKVLESDLPASAEKGGKTAGSRFGGAMGAAVRTTVGGIAGGLVGGLFGMAAKGAAEMDTAMGKLRAETGMTGAEAAAAQKSLASLYRSNLQGFDEISGAMAKIHNDLGLVGADAEKAAKNFLRFATATGQNAGEAVSAFDDILDNWGLTAADATGIMDRLIKSHQKYGGSIADNQKTLAALAPSMKAANFQIDDSIALLNLFGAKGLDANTASAAFAKALTKVKSPEELKTLIAQISATEDPFQRASLAADVFGARAGAKLANALAGANLDDYKVGIEEAAGATDDAAKAIEGSFGNQFQLMMKNATGALAEFGSQFGPILLLAGQFGPMLWAKVGGGIGGLAGLLSKRLFAVGKGAGLRLAAGLASSSVVSAVTSNLSGMFDKVGGKLGGKGGSLGKILGSNLGKAASVGFAAAMVFEVWNTYQDQKAKIDQQGKDIGASVGQQIASGTTTGLQQSKAALEKGIADLGGVFDLGLFSNDARANLQTQLNAVNAELEKQAKGIGTNATTALGAGVQAGVPAVQIAADKAVETFGISLGGIKRAAGRTGSEGMLALSQAVTAARQLPLDAFDALTEMLKNPLSRTKEAARIAGQLTSKALAEGLRSNDPAIRAQALATKQLLIDRLTALATSSGAIGKKAGAELAAGLKSKDPEIRAASLAAKNALDSKMEAAKTSAATAGTQAGTAFANSAKTAAAGKTITINARVVGHRAEAGYASGSWRIPNDQMALIHKDEMIIPARPAAAIRAGAASIPPTAGRSAPNVNVTVNNPTPEPASTSVKRELQKVMVFGTGA